MSGFRDTDAHRGATVRARTSRLVLVACLWLSAGAWGCDPPPPPPIPGETSGEARRTATAQASATALPLPYAGEQLPDEADFAKEAAKEINEENLAAKMVELETELRAAERKQHELMATAAGTPPRGAGTTAPTAAPSGSSQAVP